MNINEISDALKSVYAKDTCYHGCKDKWSPENPTAGHCAVAALIIQELFGGEINKTTVERTTHYFNILLDGTFFDATEEQFYPGVPTYEKYVPVDRNKLLKNKDVKERYTLLFQRLKNKYPEKNFSKGE